MVVGMIFVMFYYVVTDQSWFCMNFCFFVKNVEIWHENLISESNLKTLRNLHGCLSSFSISLNKLEVHIWNNETSYNY